jgi:flagellar assembly protein FliH
MSKEKLKSIPRAKMLRGGSYKLVEGPGSSVVVKHEFRHTGDGPRLNETDWLLMMADAGWEKAEQAYYIGLDEGYAKGLAEGLQTGREEAFKAAAFFEATLADLEENLLKYFTGLERWTVKLAMKIAEKVVANMADEKKDLVEQIVHKAIAETADKTRIMIRVNPSDFDALQAFKKDVVTLSGGIEHINIETDTGITPGSCRVETPSGLLDADFTTQLGELRRALILQEEARG